MEATGLFSFLLRYATIVFMTELKAKPRTELGRKVSRLRKAGFLPAVLYGEGVASQPISISFKEFEKVYKEAGESTIVELEVDGKLYNVLIHDLAHDPIKGNPTHADFYAVRMDKEISVTVPIVFIGESPAVKNEAGILVKVAQELEVEAFPQDLPHELTIDISNLQTLESKLFVKDIILSKGVKVLAEPEDVIVVVETPRSEEELAALKETPTAELKEVQTEQEVKRAEEDAKKEDTDKEE